MILFLFDCQILCVQVVSFCFWPGRSSWRGNAAVLRRDCHCNIRLEHLNTLQCEAQRCWMTDYYRRGARSNAAFMVWVCGGGFCRLSTSLGGLQELNKAIVIPGWMVFVLVTGTLHYSWHWKAHVSCPFSAKGAFCRHIKGAGSHRVGFFSPRLLCHYLRRVCFKLSRSLTCDQKAASLKY